MDHPLAVLLALVPTILASTFLHEVGHAVLGLRSGMAVTSFGLGLGRPFWVGSCRGIRIFFGRTRPTLGLTFFFAPQLYPTRRAMIATLAGGLLTNALLMSLGLAFWKLLPSGSEAWLLIAGVNALMCLTSALPYSIAAGPVRLRTDGALILKTWRSETIGQPLPLIIANVANLRGFWESIDDRRFLWINLLGASCAWLELGDVEEAGRLRAEAEAVAIEPSPFSRAYGALVRGMIAVSGGKFDDAATALDSAGERFKAIGHDAGLLVVAWYRAVLRLRQDDAAGAAASLDALVSDPIIADRPMVRLNLLASRLSAYAAIPGDSRWESLLAEYDSLRDREPSMSRDLRIDQTVARLRVQGGDEGRAGAAYLQALNALRSLRETWPDPSFQARLLQVHSGLIAEAKDCLSRQGKADEAEAIDLLFLAPEELGRQQADTRELRNRRWIRWGWRLTFANTIVAAAFTLGLPRIWWPPGPATPVPVVLLIVLPAVLNALGLIFSVVLLVVERFIPALRGIRGLMMVTFTVATWVFCLFLGSWMALWLAFA